MYHEKLMGVAHYTPSAFSFTGEKVGGIIAVSYTHLEYIPVREVLATARAAGAVVVFAHPTVYKSMPLLRELVREGMGDGIEIDHPSNSPEDKAECAARCGQYHLIHTGGTDFHGANHKKVYPRCV